MYKILIADDEKMERDLIRYLLTRDFPGRFQILEASNGEEALLFIRREKADILLTDVQMPFRNGIELASEAKKLIPDIEILFFCGFDDFEYVQNALILRAVNYILKPVNEEDFRQIITGILTRLDSRTIDFAKSMSYYQDSFYDRPKRPEEAAETTAQSDQILLENISLAISLKRPDQLAGLVDQLLVKCSDSTAHSPVYTRHIAISLLQLLMKAIPSATEADFEAAAEEIYVLRHFSDIREILLRYLEQLTADLHQEIDGAGYCVHLVRQYIAEHYGEELTLNLLAEQVYLSPNYLSNMFTKVTGCSLHKYIKNFRMKKAQELLVGSNMKIVDISRAVGYPTASYFIKTFQEVYGITPSGYRAKAGMPEKKETSETS